ncbi:MAG TPA: hypothetical protein EYH34_00035 [Planctomycetes bacterium]|nr:hypothetical protein [Planctomycetota bacterium]
MRRLVISLTAAVTVCLVAASASAQGWYGYGGFVEYHGYHEYGGGHAAYRSVPVYRYYWSPHHSRYPRYVSPYRYRYRPYRAETHAEAVRRIRAIYSRDRYYTHPRSLYNEPSWYHHRW